MDWLRYANQGATRNDPLSQELLAALAFLPELGVQMEVFSGGQGPAGSGDARLGSVRHDHGNAADVFFYDSATGRQLDWSNPQDVPLFQEIVRRARSNGVTGFGAGPGYMRPGSMHIGFGAPAVWGAGGRGDNAPEWLRAASGGATGPVGGGSTGQVGGNALSAAPQTAAQAPSQPFAPSPPEWRNSLSVETFLRPTQPVNALLPYGAGNPFFGA